MHQEDAVCERGESDCDVLYFHSELLRTADGGINFAVLVNHLLLHISFPSESIGKERLCFFLEDFFDLVMKLNCLCVLLKELIMHLFLHLVVSDNIIDAIVAE